ncbi:MAG: DUF4402 domain-containing protein [Bacteroidales bacterium]|nr:DUF4402 domain-containing protein [Bacteroidales bacterium]
MKTTFKILAVLVAIVGFSAASYGQSATATASTTIIAPLTITKSTDMKFGDVAVGASSGGTVVLSPDGTRSATGTVHFSPSNTGDISAATFNLAGVSGYTYTITLPGNTAVKVVKGSDEMTVTDFTSTPSGTGTLTGGVGTLNVGATLNVSPGQATGAYTSTTFTVTVAYN